jgi:hypothetical protein
MNAYHDALAFDRHQSGRTYTAQTGHIIGRERTAGGIVLRSQCFTPTRQAELRRVRG